MRSIAEWLIGGMATTAEGRFYTLEDGLIIAATQFKITLEQERSVGQRVDRQLTFGAKIIDLMGMYMPIGHKISYPAAIEVTSIVSLEYFFAICGTFQIYCSNHDMVDSGVFDSGSDLCNSTSKTYIAANPLITGLRRRQKQRDG